MEGLLKVPIGTALHPVRSRPARNRQGASASLTYKDAGVDIDAGSELVRRIGAKAPGIGGFGGVYSVGENALEVVGTDGVGTKLKLAFEMNVHDTVGIDLVAMNVNDIVTTGASPMYFLDQFSTCRLDMEIAEKAIEGVLEGCRQSGCELSGGKVVENSGIYPEGILYEMSGCAVGKLNEGELIDGRNIILGDVLVGLPSTGLHSNGFSLARRILEMSNFSLKDHLPGTDVTIGEALIAPTKIYVKEVLDIISKFKVKGIAHITGGGLTDNLPRIFPAGLGATIKVGSWDVPKIFKWLKQVGNVVDDEMFRTFNMGIGMVLVMDAQTADKIVAEHVPTYVIGRVTEGEGIVYDRSQPWEVDSPSKSIPRMILPAASTKSEEARLELQQRLVSKPPRLCSSSDEYCVSRAERIDDKLKIALKMNVHNTIGIDLVAVNVNGVVTTGAKPVSFVDYFSTGHLLVDVAEQVIEGIMEGCRQADCSLRGGETAEMQGFHEEGEYMLNGYASGRVKKNALIDGRRITPGDRLIGLPSSGLHTHGFPVVHRLLDSSRVSLEDKLSAQLTLGETLLLPTRIYVKEVLDIISEGGVKGVADITEGGLTGNLRNLLPPGMGAILRRASWETPHIFKRLQEAANLSDFDMLRNFNMGTGMVLVVEPEVANRIVKRHGPAFDIGEVTPNERILVTL